MLAKMQHDDPNLKDNAGNVPFAKEYRRHPIGQLMLLDLGNEAFYGKKTMDWPLPTIPRRRGC
jgi:hypothetical protein